MNVEISLNILGGEATFEAVHKNNYVSGEAAG